MRFLAILAIFCLLSLSFACNSGKDNGEYPDSTTTMEPPRRGMFVGGKNEMTESEMKDPTFLSAVDSALKKLDDSNPCHKFELVRVVRATRQVVSGMKYDIQLEVNAVFDGQNKAECSCSCFRNFSGPKQIEVSVWSQPWRSAEPNSITFKSEGALEENGKFSIN